MLAADPPQPLSWISKYVSGYAVLISTQALILNLFLAVPWFEVLEFVAILIAPSLLSGPLIYWSKRNPKKINAWLFITGIELHFLWFFSTLLLAGIKLNYLSVGPARTLVLFALLTSMISSGMLWRVCRRIRAPIAESKS